ncbi:MAG: histidine kinase [Treponematales bacterium]
MNKSGRRMRVFSALEVSNICGVVNQTVINWIRQGYLKAFTTPGGQYRMYSHDLLAFLESRGMDASMDTVREIIEPVDMSLILIVTGDIKLGGSIAAEMKEALPACTITLVSGSFEAGIRMNARKPGFLVLDGRLPDGWQRVAAAVKEDSSFERSFVILLDPAGGKAAAASGRKQADAVLALPPDFAQLVSLVREKADERPEEPETLNPVVMEAAAREPAVPA